MKPHSQRERGAKMKPHSQRERGAWSCSRARASRMLPRRGSARRVSSGCRRSCSCGRGTRGQDRRRYSRVVASCRRHSPADSRSGTRRHARPRRRRQEARASPCQWRDPTSESCRPGLPTRGVCHRPTRRCMTCRIHAPKGRDEPAPTSRRIPRSDRRPMPLR